MLASTFSRETFISLNSWISIWDSWCRQDSMSFFYILRFDSIYYKINLNKNKIKFFFLPSMEPIIRKTCSICQEDLLSDHISFTCNHCFCYKCHPFLLFNLLRSPGIDTKFFEEPQTEHLCIICGAGKTQFPFGSLFKELNHGKSSLEESKGPQKLQKLCDACQEKPAESFCINCSKSFCEGCLEYCLKPKSIKAIRSQGWMSWKQGNFNAHVLPDIICHISA